MEALLAAVIVMMGALCIYLLDLKERSEQGVSEQAIIIEELIDELAKYGSDKVAVFKGHHEENNQPNR